MARKSETPTSEILQSYGRFRFLRLEEPKAFEEGQKPRWEATQILDPSDPKGKEGIKLHLATAARLVKEAYGVTPLAIKKLAAKFLGAPKVDLNDPANADDGIKVAFIDGDAEKYKDYAGYAGMLVIPCHNTKLRPDVAGRNGKRVVPGDPQYPYDGCYGYLSSTLWCQKGLTEQKYGKRLGINLRGVQFAKDGQRYTQDEINDEFQALGDEAPAADDMSAFD